MPDWKDPVFTAQRQGRYVDWKEPGLVIEGLITDVITDGPEARTYNDEPCRMLYIDDASAGDIMKVRDSLTDLRAKLNAATVYAEPSVEPKAGDRVRIEYVRAEPRRNGHTMKIFDVQFSPGEAAMAASDLI